MENSNIDGKTAPKYEKPSGNNPIKERKSLEYYFKMAVVFGGVVIVFGIILGSYLWNLVFNPAGFELVPWLEKFIFCVIISYIMMVLGFIDLDATLRASKSSDYSRDRASFNDDVGSIYEDDTVVFFDQFIPWNAERQLRQKKIRYLAARGISTADAENIIDYANEDDLPHISGINPGEKPTDKMGEDLVKTIKYRGNDGKICEKEVVIPKIKGTNAAYVQDMLSGNVFIDVEDPSYYLTDSKTKDNNKTSLERAKATELERRKYIKRQFITKGLSMAVISLCFTLLSPDSNSALSGQERAWIFVLRLASACGGFGAGAIAGVMNVAYVTRWINDKHKVVTEFIKFLKSGLFKPYTREQLDQLKIEAFKKKKEEEEKAAQAARDAVVTPEVLPPLISHDTAK